MPTQTFTSTITPADYTQDYLRRVMGGNYLPGGPQGNPYLDKTFDMAALRTQNQLASEFGRAGRNISASQPLRAQQLEDLSTRIYGGAYETERNRQHSAVPLAGSTEVSNSPYFRNRTGELLGAGLLGTELLGNVNDLFGGAPGNWVRDLFGGSAGNPAAGIAERGAADTSGTNQYVDNQLQQIQPPSLSGVSSGLLAGGGMLSTAGTPAGTVAISELGALGGGAAGGALSGGSGLLGGGAAALAEAGAAGTAATDAYIASQLAGLPAPTLGAGGGAAGASGGLLAGSGIGTALPLAALGFAGTSLLNDALGVGDKGREVTAFATQYGISARPAGRNTLQYQFANGRAMSAQQFRQLYDTWRSGNQEAFQSLYTSLGGV